MDFCWQFGQVIKKIIIHLNSDTVLIVSCYSQGNTDTNNKIKTCLRGCAA